MKEKFSNTALKINSLKVYWNKLRQYLRSFLILPNSLRQEQSQECSWVSLVEQARVEWEQAKVLFNEAKDPGLIDHAIYAMEAAERKYMYLLKEARKGKIVHEDIYYLLNKDFFS